MSPDLLAALRLRLLSKPFYRPSYAILAFCECEKSAAFPVAVQNVLAFSGFRGYFVYQAGTPATDLRSATTRLVVGSD